MVNQPKRPWWTRLLHRLPAAVVAVPLGPPVAPHRPAERRTLKPTTSTRTGARSTRRARLGVLLGLWIDDQTPTARPNPGAELDATGTSHAPPMILRRPFELVVARTFDAVVVTVRGPVDAQRAAWLLEIVADLADADDVVDLAVDLRHTLVGGDAEVAAAVAALADWRGVTVRPPAGGVRQPPALNPSGTVCGHPGRCRLSLTPEEQVVRQREMRLHPSGHDLPTGPDQRYQADPVLP